ELAPLVDRCDMDIGVQSDLFRQRTSWKAFLNQRTNQQEPPLSLFPSFIGNSFQIDSLGNGFAGLGLNHRSQLIDLKLFALPCFQVLTEHAIDRENVRDSIVDAGHRNDMARLNLQKPRLDHRYHGSYSSGSRIREDIVRGRWRSTRTLRIAIKRQS